jgi:hypothetical protein
VCVCVCVRERERESIPQDGSVFPPRQGKSSKGDWGSARPSSSAHYAEYLLKEPVNYRAGVS